MSASVTQLPEQVLGISWPMMWCAPTASRCPAGYSVRSSSSGRVGGGAQTVIAISIIINRDSLPGLTVDS